MRTNERNRLIDESSRAMSRMVLWFAVAVIALLVFFVKLLTLNDTQAIALIATISISLLLTTLYLFRYARFNGMMTDDEPPPPPANNASDMLDFPQEHSPTRARIISRRANNQLLVCPYPFQPNDWLRLVHSLRDNDLIWSRDHSVRPANVFTNEITPGISPTRAEDWRKICRVFETMGIIRKRGKSWRVTEEGWEKLCYAAGLNVVL